MGDPAQPESTSAAASSTAKRGAERLTVGRLQDHGRSPYQFRAGEAPSYFVRLLTDHGERVIWGKDLERALANSATKPQSGDLVGARRIGREAVTVVSHERDREGRIVSQAQHLAHRNRWVIEKVQFFAERATLAHRVRDGQLDARETVRAHPELASTFLSLRGAELVAEKRIADPADRAKFVSLVREAIAASVQKGEPLPSLRLRTPEPERVEPSAPRQRDGRTR